MTDDDVTVEEQADIISDSSTACSTAFGVEGTSSGADRRGHHRGPRRGDDLGLLIGPKGHTLTAVQELSRTVVQRQATGIHHGRVRIDVGGYRQRRREALERFTQQVADQVRERACRRPSSR